MRDNCNERFRTISVISVDPSVSPDMIPQIKRKPAGDRISRGSFFISDHSFQLKSEPLIADVKPFA